MMKDIATDNIKRQRTIADCWTCMAITSLHKLRKEYEKQLNGLLQIMRNPGNKVAKIDLLDHC